MLHTLESQAVRTIHELERTIDAQKQVITMQSGIGTLALACSAEFAFCRSPELGLILGTLSCVPLAQVYLQAERVADAMRIQADIHRELRERYSPMLVELLLADPGPDPGDPPPFGL